MSLGQPVSYVGVAVASRINLIQLTAAATGRSGCTSLHTARHAGWSQFSRVAVSGTIVQQS